MLKDGGLTSAARQAVLLAASPVKHDAYVLGHGVRQPDGAVKITGYECGGADPRIDDRFVKAYEALASQDLAAQAFASRVSPVLRIQIEYYRELGKKTGHKLFQLFEPLGIKHLVLAGVESAYGLAWLTLYRTSREGLPAPQAFDEKDCEVAMYSIRGALYEWQRSFLPFLSEECKGFWGDSRFDLLQLSPAVFETALWRARGYEYAEIAMHLGISEGTVKKHLEQASKTLGVSQEQVSKLLLERMMGPLPLPRSRKRPNDD